jgi:predicted transcriptional regulator
MLEKLFGNIVIEKILFYLLANEKGYGKELKEALDIPLYSIQMALSRLEKGGIIVRQAIGKTQVYQFNPRYPFLNELKAFLTKAYNSLPEELRAQLYEAPIRN